MKTQTSRFAQQAAATMIDLLIYSMIVSTLGVVMYSLLRSSTILGAKNANINHSHDELRGVFDRVGDHLLGSNNVPTLIGTNGLAWTSTTNPAPGVKFDRIIGEPYLLNPWTGSGSLASTATSCSFWRSVADTNTAPLPEPGDIMLIPTESGNIRGVVKNVPTPPAAAGGKQQFTVNFTAAVGKSLNWNAGQPQAAKCVRPEAFVVIPNGAYNELRYYKNFDPMPTLSDKTKYKVLSFLIATGTNEGTPFTLYDLNGNGEKIVRSTLRVRERGDSNWIANDEANGYNTYFQLLVNLPSRLRPRNSQ